MKRMKRRALGLAGFALLLVTSVSFAQPPPVRVRGTVEAVDGPTLTVKSRDGQTTYKVRLTDNAAVRGIVKAALSDIKDNSFIGVTGTLGRGRAPPLRRSPLAGGCGSSHATRGR